MSSNHRENHANESVPEFVVDFTEHPDGWALELRRAGTVRYFDRGFKSREEALQAAARYARALLRAQIAAAGIGRCAERPAFDEALYRRTTVLREAAGLADDAGVLPLEGEQLCWCQHLEGVHEVLLGPCRFAGGCGCESFTVASVEAVH
jgi:hypothetical protein